MKTLCSFMIAAALLLPAAATGQETLGDVLDKSGKQLTGEELKSELVDHWINWKNRNGLIELQARPNADGTVQGRARNARGFTGELKGAWEIKPNGRFCMKGEYKTAPNSPVSDFGGCPFWFKAGDEYWVCGSDSDRSAKVQKRTVSK